MFEVMNRFIYLLVLMVFPLTQSAGITISSGYSRYYDAGEIRPISQYFGGTLTGQGFRTVVASQPGEPAGQYFITKLADAKGSGAAKARMTYFISDSKDARSFEWDLSGENLRTWLYLGLTGSDWASEDLQPLAWKIELLDAGGATLVEWKSFLWELP
jgi:hypothetical protein